MPSLIPLDPKLPIVFAPISNGEWRFSKARQDMEALSEPKEPEERYY